MKKEDWIRLVSEQERSGKTVEEFCRARGVNRKTFAVTKSQLRRESRFVPVGSPSTVEIVLPRGVVLRVAASDLVQVLRALDA